MITGAHALVYTKEPQATRAFFRDVLGFGHVDAGDGWLIFALPPAEVGVHPVDGPTGHELYLMCDDIHATVADLRGKGVEFAEEPQERGFGTVAVIQLPGDARLPIYEPRHPTAI